jgi:peptidoglycan/xylan/chitin deacetylase (PgdA/CDA1 family)
MDKNNRISRCFITLSFDDGYKETIENVLPLLSQYDIKASFNVIPGIVGKVLEGRKLADWSDLKRVNREEHEICSHSHSHRMLNSTLTIMLMRLVRGFIHSNHKLQFLKRGIEFYKESRSKGVVIDIYTFGEEAKRSRNEIENMLNTSCLSFVYPYGSYTKEAKDIIKRCGYMSARGSDLGFNDPSSLDIFCLKIQQWDKYTSVKEANKWVDYAEKRSLWLIECIHLVTEDNDVGYTFHVKLHNFKRHLEYLVGKKNCYVATQKEVASILMGNSDEV